MLRFIDYRQRRVTFTYFLLFIGVGMTGGLLGPALPHLAAMTGSSMGQIAVLFTLRAIGNMAGAFITGLLMDRLDGHRVLIGMALLAAAGLFLAPLSPSLTILALVFFVLGFSEVSLNAGGNTLLLWSHREAAAPHVSALHFCFGVGNILVPPIMMGVIALSGQFQLTFWLIAGYLLLMIWPLQRHVSPTQARTAATNVDAPGKRRDGLLLGLFMLLFGLYVGLEITFAGWITSYGVLHEMAPEDAALLVSLFWITLSLGRLLAIPLLRRYSPWRVLYGCLGLGLVSTVALHSLWLPLPLTALLFGLAASAFFPTLFGLSNQVMRMTGRSTGLVFMSAGLGAMIVPSLTGPLFDLLGARAFPLLLAGLLGLLSAALQALRGRYAQLAAREPGDWQRAV